MDVLMTMCGLAVYGRDETGDLSVNPQVEKWQAVILLPLRSEFYGGNEMIDFPEERVKITVIWPKNDYVVHIPQPGQ